ncbi:hypothetical protein [Novosphingopyxis baekryungensis]|uniref:hypothetical protein n=1 Tax=Novosphingopyxis baekryungensis TaxID=279369 RepID=UPI0012EC75AF|nr:hypothetical protein [Novosphingopyxis baekryungensis]
MRSNDNVIMNTLGVGLAGSVPLVNLWPSRALRQLYMTHRARSVAWQIQILDAWWPIPGKANAL